MCPGKDKHHILIYAEDVKDSHEHWKGKIAQTTEPIKKQLRIISENLDERHSLIL
jgi:hypothetical protein